MGDWKLAGPESVKEEANRVGGIHTLGTDLTPGYTRWREAGPRTAGPGLTGGESLAL